MIENITRYDQILTRIAFSNKLISKEQLAKAFSVQKKLEASGTKLPIDEIFLKYKMIPQVMVEDLRTATKRSFSKGFGSRALKKGFVTKGQIDTALGLQAKQFNETRSCNFIGEIMVSEGMITEEQRQVVLLEMEKAAPRPQRGTDAGASLGKTKNRLENKAEQQDAPAAPVSEEELDNNQEEERSVRLVISEDRLQARIVLSGDFRQPFEMDEIDDLLEDKGIDYSLVDTEKVNAFLQTATKEHNELVIAAGKKPIPGTDAVITYLFDTDYLGAGRVHEDGTIDYKDRGEVPHVSSGDLIAEKTPSVEGREGMDVFGEAIPVPEPEDKELICDSGVTLSADGLQAFANVEGQPNVTVTGKLSVFDEFQVAGDVDYQTGNIAFDGNINVQGAVKDGFSVTGGNLTASEVQEARIHLKGNLTVNGGIFGATIQTEGSVVAKYIKNANIKSYGDVIVGKEILDSKIRTSGKCIVEQGKIISSLVTAKEGIEAKQIGTDVSPPCTIKVGQDEHIRKIIQGFDYTIQYKRQRLERDQEKYEKLLGEQKTIHARIAELAQGQERNQMLEKTLQEKVDAGDVHGAGGEKEKLTQALRQVRENADKLETVLADMFAKQDNILEDISAWRSKIEYGVKEIETAGREKHDIMEWAKKEPGNPVVAVKNEIHGGTRIICPHVSIVLEDTEKNVLIREISYGELEKKWKIELSQGGSGASAFKKKA